MQKTITLKEATIRSIRELRQPLVTKYQVGVIVFCLYLQKEYQGISLRTKKSYPEHRDFSRIVEKLFKDKIIRKGESISKPSSFFLIGKYDVTPQEVVCIIDSFSYISHLSAMFFHGISEKKSDTIYLSSPVLKKWKKLAGERMEKDCLNELNRYNHIGLPKLTKPTFLEVYGQKVHNYSSMKLGGFMYTKNKNIRVATISYTFLDMLRKSNLCGGIHHVLNIYREHAKKYLNLIVEEIEIHGTPIEKVRAGYILEEHCGLYHDLIESWRQYIQRGGSRKLDPEKEYSPKYSERWCLSLNF